jgi:hypothetical protein
MYFRKALLAAIAGVAMSVSIGLMGQGLTDGVKVTLPHPVTVGEVVLDPGEYEIRRASTATDQVLRIFSNDQLRYQANVITIPTQGNETPGDTKVVLHHIGDNYYFDKIWMQGKDYGYEFVLPERVAALKRELSVSVPARYESQSQGQPQPRPEPGSVQAGNGGAEEAKRQAEADAARADSEREAALAESNRKNAEERERQAGLKQQAQEDRERQAQVERDQQSAALQQTPSDARPAPGAQVTPQSSVQNAEQLPATASNWLGFVLAGILLLTLSVFLRTRPQE